MRTDKGEHSTSADFNYNKRKWEEDVSNARPEQGDENMANNTVLTGRQTDTDLVGNSKSASEGNSSQPERLYLDNGLRVQVLTRSFIYQNIFTGSRKHDWNSTISV